MNLADKEQQIIDWQGFLHLNKACKEGYKEAHTQTPQEWWQSTKRPDWMIWVLRKTEAKNNTKLFVQIALFAAESVVHLSKDEQKRPQKAIEAVKAWLLDPSEENRIACHDAAAYAVDDAAVDAAAAAAAAAAAYAAYAAAAAANAAAYAAAAYAAYAAAKREQIANYIRQIHPNLTLP